MSVTSWVRSSVGTNAGLCLGRPRSPVTGNRVVRRYGRPVPWMIILGDCDAIAWVLSNGRMAVNGRVAALPDPGERVALYVTRGAYRNPTRDRAQIIGLAQVTEPPEISEVVVAGRSYAKSFGLRFDDVAEPRAGLPFEPLVPRLRFIGNKASWGGAVRRPVVRLSEADFRVIEEAYRAHRSQRRGHSRS
jgi:hypothetical protein